MLYCHDCSCSSPDGAAFCVYCGGRFDLSNMRMGSIPPKPVEYGWQGSVALHAYPVSTAGSQGVFFAHTGPLIGSAEYIPVFITKQPYQTYGGR